MKRYKLTLYFRNKHFPGMKVYKNTLEIDCKTLKEVDKELRELLDDTIHSYDVCDNAANKIVKRYEIHNN